MLIGCIENYPFFKKLDVDEEPWSCGCVSFCLINRKTHVVKMFFLALDSSESKLVNPERHFLCMGIYNQHVEKLLWYHFSGYLAYLHLIFG